MSQFTRSFASATSFASKRSYAQTPRLSASAVPAANASVAFSNPGSPTAAFFGQLGNNARTPSHTQVPFASSPHLPAGISPASQPPMTMWATSPPRSPSQLHFRMQQATPPSPSQLLFGANVAAFTPAQSLHDFGFTTFGAPESVSPVFTGSPATSSRSMSPGYLEPSQPSSLAGVTNSAPKVKRDDAREAKKGLNPFTYYRKTFPARYPHIDALIPTQMERSRLTGAFWQHESVAVREKCEGAVYINRTQAQIDRLENIRLQTQEKRRQERIKAGTDKLSGRNALIFKLWQRNVPTEQFTATVLEFDRENPLPEPARKRRRKAPVRKLDAEFMLAAERFSIASSSPQPSTSSISQSPAVMFNPELPSAVVNVQNSWAPLSTAVMQGNYEAAVPDVISVELPEPLMYSFAPSTSPQAEGVYLTPDVVPMSLAGSTLYDGMLMDYSSATYPLGSDDDMDALLQAYAQQPSFQQDGLVSNMDHEFNNFMSHALPTEEDGLLFDVAYFGPSSALDA